MVILAMCIARGMKRQKMSILKPETQSGSVTCFSRIRSKTTYKEESNSHGKVWVNPNHTSEERRQDNGSDNSDPLGSRAVSLNDDVIF